MSDLKPCPFCGATEISDGEVLTEHDGTTYTQSECQGCGALGPRGHLLPGEVDYGDAKAIEAWNRRAQPAQAGQLHQALTDPENQPNQYGVEFFMHGPKFAFKVGTQQFTLDYEPTEPGEFEFMQAALIYAFSVFTPDVKTAQAGQVLTEKSDGLQTG